MWMCGLIEPPEEPCFHAFSYTVRPGDTLNMLAERFGTTVPDLLDANPDIQSARSFAVGTVLAIPRAPVRTVPPMRRLVAGARQKRRGVSM